MNTINSSNKNIRDLLLKEAIDNLKHSYPASVISYFKNEFTQAFECLKNAINEKNFELINDSIRQIEIVMNIIDYTKI